MPSYQTAEFMLNNMSRATSRDYKTGYRYNVFSDGIYIEYGGYYCIVHDGNIVASDTIHDTNGGLLADRVDFNENAIKLESRLNNRIRIEFIVVVFILLSVHILFKRKQRLRRENGE